MSFILVRYSFFPLICALLCLYFCLYDTVHCTIVHTTIFTTFLLQFSFNFMEWVDLMGGKLFFHSLFASLHLLTSIIQYTFIIEQIKANAWNKKNKNNECHKFVCWNSRRAYLIVAPFLELDLNQWLIHWQWFHKVWYNIVHNVYLHSIRRRCAIAIFNKL